MTTSGNTGWMMDPDSSLDSILLRQYLEGGECRSNRKRAGSDITTGNWCMLFEVVHDVFKTQRQVQRISS